MQRDASQCPLTFRSPFNMVVAGPSQVGKSTFVRSLLAARKVGAIEPQPDRIKYVYGEVPPNLGPELRVECYKGWSADHTEDMDPSVNNVIILDDVANDCKDDAALSNLFTRGGHHRNISIILVTQNYFFPGKCAVDIRRNTHYLVLFACKQDRKHIASFMQRILPTKWRSGLTAYEDATSKRHGHLLVDMSTQCPDEYMLRANTLNEFPHVYII